MSFSQLFQILLLYAFSGSSSSQKIRLFALPQFQGRSKQISVTRCTNIHTDFNDITSSLRTQQCVMLYEDVCCQGLALQVTNDMNRLPRHFDNQASSIGPCIQKEVILPEVLVEEREGRRRCSWMEAEARDVAVYYDLHVNRTLSGVKSQVDFLKRLWMYVKDTYGHFGPEGGRLLAFLHTNSNFAWNNTSSSHTYFEAEGLCRNQIDLVSPVLDGWTGEVADEEMAAITRQVASIVEFASKEVFGSPAHNLWRDKWAEILIYDVYNALGLHRERTRWLMEIQDRKADFPRNNTFWFRDWFYPLYRGYGGSKLFRSYFDLLARHFPRDIYEWQYAKRTMNLGEFVHFWSGAARKDLTNLAKLAFAWDEEAEKELEQARKDFPNLRMSF